MSQETFGKALRNVREAFGISQRELDRRSGVNHAYISQLENEVKKVNPSREVVESLASVIGQRERLMLAAGYAPDTANEPDPYEEAKQFERVAAHMEAVYGDDDPEFARFIVSELKKTKEIVIERLKERGEWDEAKGQRKDPEERE